ncbi:MAG: threonine 3-dehydrogenase [Gammaproteobacteria bacterium]|jgi:threonine 3-dehydrogenase
MMRAMVKTEPGPGGVEIRSVPTPQAGAGEVLLRVVAAGICGTDMQIYHWAPRMARRMSLPRVLGHEVCGVIEALGSGVRGLAVGQRVALESHIFCGQCRQCRLGQAHLCNALQYPGIDIEGGFAERVSVPAQIAVPVPDALADTTVAMLEPFGIAVHASMAGDGVAGRRVLINGCGPIGLMNVAAARALGAQLVIAADPNPKRLQMALEMGADRGLDPGEHHVANVVRDMTGGYGVDVVCEYTGSPVGFDTAVAALAKGASLRLVGGPAHPHKIDLTYWLANGLSVHAIHGRRLFEDWEHAFELLASSRVDLAPLASHVLPLEDAVRGFELVIQGDALKPLIVPA